MIDAGLLAQLCDQVLDTTDTDTEAFGDIRYRQAVHEVGPLNFVLPVEGCLRLEERVLQIVYGDPMTMDPIHSIRLKSATL